MVLDRGEAALALVREEFSTNPQALLILLLTYLLKKEKKTTMKFTAIKDNLTSGLSIVQRALSTKSVQPILSGIYLSAKNGHLTMVATDTIENAGCAFSARCRWRCSRKGNGCQRQELPRICFPPAGYEPAF